MSIIDCRMLGYYLEYYVPHVPVPWYIYRLSRDMGREGSPEPSESFGFLFALCLCGTSVTGLVSHHRY